MSKYIIRRFIQSVFILFAISVITFGIAKATPGGPFGFDDPDIGARIPEAMRKRYREVYGLDQPVPVQYLNWLRAALQGDLGVSYGSRNQNVSDILGRTWPISAQLGLIATSLALLFGVTLGIIAAVNHNTLTDYLTMFISVVGTTIPTFVLAIIAIVIFSVELRWFPVSGWGTPERMILPVFVLMLGPMAGVARYTRTSMLEVINLDFVRTAYAKGLTRRRVIIKHVIRNALIPVVTITGPILAGLLTGSFFVETMFSVPGMGSAFINAAANRDYPMIMANTMIYAALIVFLNLAVDVTYGIIDPRIRYD